MVSSPLSIEATHERPVSRIRNRIFSSNTYFYHIPGTKDCLVIDPGLDFEGIDAHLLEQGLRPIGVVCTHGHFDHLGSAQPLKEKYGIKLAFNGRDLRVAKAANFLLMACKIEHRITTPSIDLEVEGHDTEILFGHTPVRFLHTPGHTPGSSFLVIGNCVFTGDTLYRKAVGLVDFPGEDKDVLRKSILGIWDKLPDTHWIYPGHGGSDSFGNIKKLNTALRAFLGLDSSEAGFTGGAFDEE